MATNDGWPEAFGFSVSGDAPVVISSVEEGGSAQQAGLQTGDVIVELDGENVQQWDKEEVITRARRASKVPPSLVVISRVRKFDLPRASDGGFGITLRGDCPVFIRSVDFHSPARAAGVRSGDLLLELNSHNVRYASKSDVLELLKKAKKVLHLMVIAGGLTSGSGSSLGTYGSKAERKYHKARAFHQKVNYYLMHDDTKKSHLLTLLRLYARDRDVNSLGSSLDILLDSPTERRLLPNIRGFLHPTHRARFDALVSYTPGGSSQMPSGHPAIRKGSYDVSALGIGRRPLAATRDAPWRSSMPNLTTGERRVTVNRGRSGYGFTLSGNAPVFIRAVDVHGAAAQAGLRAGDHILELNGLNVRNSTHSHVVRLLKGSGTHPSLLVTSQPPERRGGRRGSTASLPAVEGASNTRKHSTAFKDKMEQILLQDERHNIIQQLSNFSQHKNLPQLVEGLGSVLNDPTKMVLFHYICQLLPTETQTEFDRIAAATIAGDPAMARSSLAGSEAVGDILYRVQSGILESRVESSPRRISTSHFNTAGGGMTPVGVAPGGMAPGGMAEEELYGGDDLVLQDTPIRQVGRFTGDSSPESLVLGKDIPERLPAEERKTLREKREDLENTPVGQNLSQLLGGGTPQRRAAGSQATTPTGAQVNNSSSLSTPGIPPPPTPPPTPQGGVGGVPVPPPPPPSLPDSGTQSHLKRVNWEKLHGTEGTIWRELSGLEDALEYCELEKQFAVQQPKDAKTKKDKRQATILEPRKAYNISILLGHLKLSNERIREAILTCDDTVLSEQHLKQLEAFAPNKKECLGFARYYDNPSALSPPDRFSCEMSAIPGYRERLRAMIFMTHFKEKTEEIKPDLEAISLASVQLQSSKSFKRILEIVLAVGNYMNAGHHRIGGALGFRIKYLTELKSLRTSDNKSSLLHFLANTVERKYPQVLDFPGDLGFISKAARVSGQTLEVEISELRQGLSDIRRDVRDISSREKVPGDRFPEVMTAFLSEAEGVMSGLLRLYMRMKQEYQKAIRFFGEDISKMRIDEFFGTFATFVTDFEKAVQDNRNAREQEVLREKRIKEREELAKKRRSQKTSSKFVADTRSDSDLKRELQAWRPPSTSDEKTRGLSPTQEGDSRPQSLRDRQQRKGRGRRRSGGVVEDVHPHRLSPELSEGLEFDSETHF